MTRAMEFEGRVDRALKRISTAVEALNNERALTQAENKIDELRSKLKAQTQANADLQQKMQELESSTAKELAARDVQSQALQDRLATLVSQSAALKDENKTLSNMINSLTQVNKDNLGNADLINAAMKIELEGLRAARAVEVAEIEALLSELGHSMGLDPVPGEAADA